MIHFLVLARVSAVTRSQAALEARLQAPTLSACPEPHLPQRQSVDAGAQSRGRQKLSASLALFVPQHLQKHNVAVDVIESAWLQPGQM